MQYLAEWGTVPGVPKGPHLDSAEFSLAFESIPWSVEGRPTWYAHDVRGLHRRLAHLDRRPGSVGPSAINNPPLYYALDAVPYELGRSAYFFDTLLLMRLLAALLAAVTVAFTFLFVREVLPSQPWAARVGALAVAFQPMFGFMSGAVNNDMGVNAGGAVLIYLLVRALVRGLSTRLALAPLADPAREIDRLQRPGCQVLVLCHREGRSHRSLASKASSRRSPRAVAGPEPD